MKCTLVIKVQRKIKIAKPWWRHALSESLLVLCCTECNCLDKQKTECTTDAHMELHLNGDMTSLPSVET